MHNAEKSLAPIALFCYNRPRHLKGTLDALRKNKLASRSELFIFSDAPRSTKEEPEVKEVRSLIRNVKGFANVRLFEAEKNRGLSDSVIFGVSLLCKEYGKVIVLEDDMESVPFFLEYMNQALDQYEKEDRIASVHAYSYPIKKLPSSFFLRGADCWGWATWSRAWDDFEPDGQKLIEKIREQKLEHRFNFDGSYPYIQMLEAQVQGRNQSWAVRWYASAFVNNKLTLYPGRSLVRNTGNDASGTHSGQTAIFEPLVADHIPDFPAEIKESREAYRLFTRFFRRLKLRIVLGKFIMVLSGKAS